MNKVTSYFKNVKKSISYATVDAVSNTVPEVKEFINTNKDVLGSIYFTLKHTKASVKQAQKSLSNNQIYKDINKGVNNVFEDIKTGNFYNVEREKQYENEAAQAWIGEDEFDINFDLDFDDDDGSLDNFNDTPNIKESSIKEASMISDSVSKSSNLSAQLISKTVANTSKSIIDTQIGTTNVMIAQNVELMAGLRTTIQGVHESVNQILRFNTENVTNQINNEATYFEKTTEILQENNSILKEMLQIQKDIYKGNSTEYKSRDETNNIFTGSTIDLKEYFKIIGKNIKGLDSTGSIEMMTSAVAGQSMLGSMMANPLGFLVTGLVQKFMPSDAVRSISSLSKSIGALFPALISKFNKLKNQGGIGGILGNLLSVNVETKKKIDTGNYNKGAVPFDGITRKAIVDVIPEHLARIESLISGKSQRIYDYNSGKWTSIDEVKKKQAEDEGYYIKNSYGDLNSTINNFISNLQQEKALSYQDKKNLNEDLIEMMRPFFEKGVAFSSVDARRNKTNGKYKFKNDQLIDALLDVLDNEPVYKQLGTASDIFYNKNRYASYLRDEERKGDSLTRKVFDKSMDDTESFTSGILTILKNASFPTTESANASSTTNTTASNKNDEEKKFNDYYYNPNTNINDAIKNVVSKTKKETIKDEKDDYSKYGTFFNSDLYKSIVNKIPEDSFIGKVARNPGTLIAGLVEKADRSIYNFLFDTDTGTIDPENNEKIKGIFDSMVVGMKQSLSNLIESFDRRVLEPLEEKYGLKTKFRNVVNKLVGEVQKDENGNIIKNEYGFASRSNGKFTGTLTALQRKYRAAQKYTKDSINKINSLVRDPVIIELENDINEKYDLSKVDDIVAIQERINKLTPEQKKKLSKTLKEKLKAKGIYGFAKGGKLRNRKNKKRSGTVKKPGIIEVSEGETVTVESNHTEAEQEKNEQEETKRGFEYIANDMLGKSTEKLKAKIKENKTANGIFDKIKDIYSDIKDKGSEIGADSIIGGGAGLLIGNPIIGALLGASVSIVKNSQTMQKIMFGERNFDENGYITEQEGGLINKDIQNTFKKYIPDMAKFGAAGIVSSLIMPYGPLAGAAIGAGISFIKNSQTMNEMIFGKDIVDENGNVTGKDNSGLLTPARIKKIKEYAPKAAVGAIGGMVLGPFGLLGNAALGAGIGMITGTEEFKNLIFGEDDGSGNRIGGLKAALNENFVEPLREFGTNFKEDFFGFIQESMIDPLNRAITPIANEIAYQTKRVVFGIPKMFAGIGKEYIAQPLIRILDDKILSPLGSSVNGIVKSLTGRLKGIVSLPFRAIGGIGDHLRKKQIRQGRDTGSAKNRIQFAESHKMGNYAYKQFDEALADNSDNEDYLKELTARTGMLANGAEYFEKQVKQAGREVSAVLGDYYKLGWFAKDKKSYDRIRKYIKNNDIESAINELTSIKESRTNGGRLDDATANEAIDRFTKANKKYQVAKEAREKFGTINKEENEKWMEEQFGKGWKNKMDANKMFKYSSDELYRLNGQTVGKNDPFNNPDSLIIKETTKTNDILDEIKDIVTKIGKGEFIDETKSKEFDEAVEKGKEQASEYSNNLKGRIKTRLDSNNISFDDNIVDKLYSNDDVYELVLYAKTQGYNYDKNTINKLCDMKLSNDEIEYIKSNPAIALAEEKVIRKFASDSRNNYGSIFRNRLFGSKKTKNTNRKLLKSASKLGIKLDSKTAEMLTYGGRGFKYDHETRLNYYKKFKDSDLIDKSVDFEGKNIKITKEMILDVNNGLSYDEMDQIIQESGGVADIDHNKSTATAAIRNFIGPKSKTIKKGLGFLGKGALGLAFGLPLGLIGGGVGLAGLLGKGASTAKNNIDQLMDLGIKGYIANKKIKNQVANDDNLDNEVEDTPSKPGFKEKFKTVFTEHGPKTYFLNKRGQYKEVNSTQNKETDEKANEDNEERKGIISSLSSLKDSFLGFFGKKDKKEDGNKKSWWQKLLESPLASFVGKAATVGGILYGIGKFSSMWTNEGEDGPMHTVANNIKNALSPIFEKAMNWLTGSEEYAGGGLPKWTEDFFEHMFGGVDFIVGKVLPKLVEALIKALPTVIKSGLSGLGSILGIGNKNNNDNKGTDSDFNTSTSNISSDFSIGGANTSNVAKKYFGSSSSTDLNATIKDIQSENKSKVDSLTWKGIDTYTKNSKGDLVKLPGDANVSNLNEFYTESGVKYVRGKDGTWEPEGGVNDVSREDRDTLGSRLLGATTRSFFTGRNIANPITGMSKVFSKIPGLKTFGKFLNPVGKVTSGIINSGAGLNRQIQDIAENYLKKGDRLSDTLVFKGQELAENVTHKLADSKAGKAILNATSKLKNSNISKIIDFVKSSFTKIFGLIKNKFADCLKAAGKEATEEAVEKSSKKLVSELMEKFSTIIVKTSESAINKLTTKMSQFLSSGGLINAAFAVKDFLWGFDQAKSILGIDEVNFIQRFLAGLVNAVNNFVLFGIIDTSTIVNWLSGPVLTLFGQDADEFKKKQEEADEIVKQYNLKENTNYSKEEYYKNQTLTGKVDNFVSDIWQGTKNGVKKFISWINPFDNDKSKASETNGALSTATAEAKKSLDASVNQYSSTKTSIDNIEDVTEAGSLSIGAKQANSLNTLSANLESADAILDKKLGVLYGFTDSSGKHISLSEAVTTIDPDSIVRKDRGQVTFADVINNMSATFGAMNQLTSNALAAATPSTTTKKTTSTKSSNNIFKTFYNTITGRGTMNEEGFVSQLDPRFKNKKFNTGKDSEVQTLGDSGCAPATAANVLNLYAGKGTVMDDASNAALKYKDKNSGVTPDYFQNYLGSNGIGTYSTMNKNEMLAGIGQGRPTILLGSDPTNKAKTPYGSASSHYVLATGLDGKGNVIIQDPESKRPNSLYPVRDVIKQTTLGMVTGKGSMDVRSMKSKLKAKLGKVGFGRGSNTVNQDLAKWSPITEGQLNSEIRRLAGPNRGFSGKGKYFIAAANASGLDPRYILAHAALESAWGDSNYAKAGNFFGIGAFDSNPDNAYNYGNSDMESGLINGAVWIRKNFYDAGQTTLYKMRHNNGSHEYATDPNWDNKIASIMDQLPANSSASYHEASENTTSNTNTNSSGLLDALDNLVLSYFNEDGKNLISALFGSNSSSSSDDSTTSSTTSSGYSSGDSKTAKEFYDKYNGVAVDYDGAYGAQCVDLFKQYSDEVLGLKNYVVGGNGGAYNIAYDSRLNPYYDKVSLKDAKYGDWVVWNPTSETNATYGHVAMFTGMDGNYIKAFGTNQGGPGGAANTINVPSGSVAAVLRAKTFGKGSGKVKSSSYQSLPNNMLNGYRRKSVSTPIRSANTVSISGTGTTTLPSLNYSSTTSGFNVSRAVNGTTTYSVASDSSTARLENLVSVVIDVLRIIADNSSKLSEIVTLLSKALDVNLTNDDIKNLSSNNAQIKNKIANALKSQGSPNGMGNSIMESSTESLANALYSIARA